ncbi:hypothetical protein Tco_1415072, partial [Tanacetum coccineum]
MDTTKAQQNALDDAFVAPENRLNIRKCNQCLSSTLKSNEPTIQVALDALKLTPVYNAFEVSTDVPEIYMQEFWATVTKHHFSLWFKLNGKIHTVNVDNFRDMLKIYPKLPGHKFEEPTFEEEILPHIRDLRHTGDISGKTNGLERLHLSRAQLLWGMYYNKHIDYVYLLWEDFVFQVENKDSKKNNDMDDSMFTTIRVISKDQDTQIYGANLPLHLTNQAMLESESYKTYHAYATGKKTPKPKKKKADSELSPKEKHAPASKGKRLKTSSKAAQSTKEKQPATKSKAKGLTVILPSSLMLELEQVMRGFLWCQCEMKRGKAKVTWDDVCLPKIEGGLGIQRLEHFNKALISTHIWSILTNKESLWVKWIYSYKLNGRSLWEIPLRGNMSWGWRKILQVRHLVRPLIWSRIGDGTGTLVWFDNWSTLGPLTNIISNRDIYMAGFRLDASVAEIIQQREWAWPIEWQVKYPLLNTI